MRNLRFGYSKNWMVYLGAVVILLVSGCTATVEMASQEADSAAKLFDPSQEEANLYVTRKDQFTGSAVLFQIAVDGRLEGGLAPGTYRVISVAPGRHVISVTTAENQSTQAVDAAAGECYFFEVKPKMGMIAARAEVLPMTRSEGQKAVAENSLAMAFAYDR
jgi:hypothetical protein